MCVSLCRRYLYRVRFDRSVIRTRVIWNSCFCRILTVAGVKMWLTFCFTASRYVCLTWLKKSVCSGNMVISMLTGINRCKINMILSKYRIMYCLLMCQLVFWGGGRKGSLRHPWLCHCQRRVTMTTESNINTRSYPLTNQPLNLILTLAVVLNNMQ